MKYLSVCSGIEAATVAWHPLGWQPVAFSEIEPFPSAVLAHHYPTVPNWGDMTRFKEWPDAAIDVLVGGTPCQSFSVAGLRKGLADPRGNLALTYLAIAERYRPRWLVWENVPGVLSADEGRALGAFLGGLAELGFGFAWRVLDAQYFGLAQRRKRVFVVGHLGDWRCAASVLFESASLRGDPPPSRGAGEGVAGSLASRSTAGGGLGTDFEIGGGLTHALRTRRPGEGGISGDDTQLVLSPALNTQSGSHHAPDTKAYVVEHFELPEIVGTLSDGAHMGGGLNGQDAYSGRIIPVAFDTTQITSPNNYNVYSQEVADPITAVFHKHYGASGGKDSIPRNHIAVAFDTTQITSAANYSNPQPGDPCHPLASGAHPPAVAFNMAAGNRRDGTQDKAYIDETEVSLPIDCIGQNPDRWQGGTGVAHAMQVRRLTCRECERLQGFPDDYTLIPYRNKLAADGPRYKALGNSMAVPVMRWIGQRISNVEQIMP